MGADIEGVLLDAIDVAKSNGLGASLLLKDNVAIALMTFIHDDTRDGSDALISSLDQRNVNVEILSGDTQEAVSQFARSVD